MKTLLIIWLAAVAVGAFTINRVDAWTTGVNVYHLQSPIGLQSQPSKLQVGADPRIDWGGMVYDPDTNQFVSGFSQAGHVGYQPNNTGVSQEQMNGNF